MTGPSTTEGSWRRVRAAIRLSRPDQVLLIVVVYAVGCVAGAALARTNRDPWSTGALPVGTVALVGLAVVAVAVSVHAVNEYADAGTDARTVRTRFSGGSGALAAHGLAASFALRVAVGAALVAVLVTGAASAAATVPHLAVATLALGLLGGWAYSAGPWPFSRHGWGEVVNAALGGMLLPVTGGVVVGAPVGAAVTAFLPFTLLAFVNLLETQWADREADRAVGKDTLASRLPAGRLRLLGAAAALTAYALSLATLPAPVALAGLLAAPLSAHGVRRLGRGAPGPSVAAMVVFLLAQGAAWVLRS